MYILGYFLLYLCLCKTVVSEVVLGVDIGSENVHAALFGETFSFKLLPTKSGKKSFPSLIMLDSIRRYGGEDAVSKVCCSLVLVMLSTSTFNLS